MIICNCLHVPKYAELYQNVFACLELCGSLSLKMWLIVFGVFLVNTTLYLATKQSSSVGYQSNVTYKDKISALLLPISTLVHVSNDF